MSEAVLNANIRERIGKKISRKLRVEGKVPGIYYAHDEKNIPLVFNAREVIQLISKETALLDLKVNNQKPRKCILREIQFDPVTNFPVHLDIMGVKLKEKINVTVPVHIIGEAVGVKVDNGILNQVLHDLDVLCLPLDIPDYIDVDVSNLRLGDGIYIRNIVVDKVEILNEADVLVVNVVATRAVKEAQPVVELEVAEEPEEGEKETE